MAEKQHQKKLLPHNLIRFKKRKLVINHDDMSWGDKMYLGVVLLLFGSFLFQAILFSSLVRQGVTPDENYHLSLIFLHKHHSSLWLENTSHTLFLGNIERIPMLYHLVLGKLVSLNFVPISDYAFLKAMNILLSFGTVLFSFFAFRVASNNRLVHILGLGILTHLAGYTFLSGAVHPMTMLHCVIAAQIYFLFRYVRDRSTRSLTYMLLCFFLAPLISVTAFAVNTVTIFVLWFSCRKDIKRLLGSITVRSKAFLVALACCVGFAANGLLYGTNLMEFGRAIPLCYQVLSFEQCVDGRFTFRNEVEQTASQGRTPFMVSTDVYLKHWGRVMTERVTGVVAMQKFCFERDSSESCGIFKGKYFWHETKITQHYLVESGIFALLVIVVAALVYSAYSTVKNIRKHHKDREPSFLLYGFMICTFLMVSVFATNYGMYQGSGNLNFGVYGHNIFAVLPIFCFIVAYLLLKNMPRRLQFGFVTIVVCFFVWGSFPTFLRHNKTSELIASTPNIVPLIRCDMSLGICNKTMFPDRWSYCMPEKDWRCLDEESGTDMVF